MADREDVTLRTAFRRSPYHMSLFVGVPLVLAVAQIANAAVLGFPLWAAGAFALAMVTYAALYTRLHCTRLRVRALERAAAAPDRRPSSASRT